MSGVLAAVSVIAAALIILTVRYWRHRPRGFAAAFYEFRPALATHRGYGKHAAIPENTILAFQSSERLGFRAHELDVRRTRDGQIMLLHGPRLEETTDGRGRMEESDAAQVRKLNAAHYVTREHPHAKARFERVPTLSEVLSAISADALINVEIKRDRWDFSRGLEEETLRLVNASAARNRVFFSGFHFITLWRLRALKSAQPVGLLVEPGMFSHVKNFLYRFLLLPDNIHLHESRESAAYMQRLKKRGYGLAFWTVNKIEQVNRLFATGADVVITDRMEFIDEVSGKEGRAKPRARGQRKKASRRRTALA